MIKVFVSKIFFRNAAHLLNNCKAKLEFFFYRETHTYDVSSVFVTVSSVLYETNSLS